MTETERAPGAVAVVARPRWTNKKVQYVEERAANPGLSPVKAAILVGFSPAEAKRISTQWEDDPAVAEAIAAACEERGVRRGVAPEDILRELMLIAFSSLDDLVIDDGNVWAGPEAPAHAIRTVSAIKKKTTVNAATGDVTTTTEVRLWDKMAALKLLGEHLGMWLKRVRIEDDEKTRATLDAMKQAMDAVNTRLARDAAEDARIAQFQREIAATGAAVAASADPMAAMRRLAATMEQAPQRPAAPRPRQSDEASDADD